MDPFFQVVISALTVIAAAVGAVIIGSRKGLADVEARGDAEMARLVAALEGRIKVLEADLASANQRIGELKAQSLVQATEIARLQGELINEQRITARMVRPAR